MYKLISFVEKVYSHRNLLEAAIKQISFAVEKYLLPVKRSKINVLKFLLQFLRRHNLQKSHVVVLVTGYNLSQPGFKS